MQNRINNTFSEASLSRVNVMIHLKCPTHMEHWNVVFKNKITLIGLKIFEKKCVHKIQDIVLFVLLGLDPCMLVQDTLLCSRRSPKFGAQFCKLSSNRYSPGNCHDKQVSFPKSGNKFVHKCQTWGCCPQRSFQKYKTFFVSKHCISGLSKWTLMGFFPPVTESTWHYSRWTVWQKGVTG